MSAPPQFFGSVLTRQGHGKAGLRIYIDGPHVLLEAQHDGISVDLLLDGEEFLWLQRVLTAVETTLRVCAAGDGT